MQIPKGDRIREVIRSSLKGAIEMAPLGDLSPESLNHGKNDLLDGSVKALRKPHTAIFLFIKRYRRRLYFSPTGAMAKNVSDMK